MREHYGEEWSHLRPLVASLDPLGLDDVFRRLPRLAGNERARWILEQMQRATPSLPYNEDPAVLHAALRDIGILAAAMRRDGVEPTVAMPGFDQVLSHIGANAAHVPRETILHYSVFNPIGARRRRYSPDPQEDALIDAITVGADSVVAAIRSLSGTPEMSMASVEFRERCEDGARNLSRLVHAMTDVAKSVTPVFFAEVLRPHWEPMIVPSGRYDGPGPVQLPVYLLDALVWAAGTADVNYRAYADHNIDYTLEEFRNLYTDAHAHGSLVTTYRNWSATTTAPTLVQRRARDAILQLLTNLVNFRRVHRSVAFRAYGVRRMTEPKAVGSSGYGPEVLPPIVGLTELARRALLASDAPTDPVMTRVANPKPPSDIVEREQ